MVAELPVPTPFKVWARAWFGHGPRRRCVFWRIDRDEPLKPVVSAGLPGTRGVRSGIPGWKGWYAHTFQGVGTGVVRTWAATAVRFLAHWSRRGFRT